MRGRPLARAPEPRGLGVLAPERLHRRQRPQRLLHDGERPALPLTRVPGSALEGGAEQARRQQQRRRHPEAHGAQERAQPEERRRASPRGS